MLMLTVSILLSFAYCEGTRGTNLISCLCGFGAFIFYQCIQWIKTSYGIKLLILILHAYVNLPLEATKL